MDDVGYTPRQPENILLYKPFTKIWRYLREAPDFGSSRYLIIGHPTIACIERRSRLWEEER